MAGRLAIAELVLGVALVVVSGCSLTQKAAIKSPGRCAFLRPVVCDKLTPGSSSQAGMRYTNPQAQWRQYSKIMILPITFWGGETPKISDADRQALADYFYQTLVTHLATKFAIVDQPGEGVMRLGVAITDAETATPVLRTVSMIVPQARALKLARSH